MDEGHAYLGAPTPSESDAANVPAHDRLPKTGNFPLLWDHEGNAVDVLGAVGADADGDAGDGGGDGGGGGCAVPVAPFGNVMANMAAGAAF